MRLGIQSLRKRDQEFTGLENTELAWNSLSGDDGDTMRLRHRSTHSLPAPVCYLPPSSHIQGTSDGETTNGMCQTEAGPQLLILGEGWPQGLDFSLIFDELQFFMILESKT